MGKNIKSDNPRKHIWLTEDRAAEYLGVHRRTLYDWRRDGGIRNSKGELLPAPPYYKPSGKYYYDQNDLDDWIMGGKK